MHLSLFVHVDKSRAEPEGYIMPEAQTRAHLGPAAGRPALPLPSTSTAETTEAENAGGYLGLIPDRETRIYDDLKP